MNPFQKFEQEAIKKIFAHPYAWYPIDMFCKYWNKLKEQEISRVERRNEFATYVSFKNQFDITDEVKNVRSVILIASEYYGIEVNIFTTDKQLPTNVFLASRE